MHIRVQSNAPIPIKDADTTHDNSNIGNTNNQIEDAYITYSRAIIENPKRFGY